MVSVKRPSPASITSTTTKQQQEPQHPQSPSQPLAKRPRTAGPEARIDTLQDTQRNDIDSDHTASDKDEDDDDASSVLSTSSSDPSSSGASLDGYEDDDDANNGNADEGSDPRTRIRPTSKVTAEPSRTTTSRATSLRAQIQSFLPQLRTANESLDQSAPSAFEIIEGDGTKEDAEQGARDDDAKQPYIEMDLGLGVLEEKRPGEDSDSSDDSGDDEAEGGDVLGRLMGRRDKDEGEAKKAVIQEL
ncbi:hypothetical protein FH972_022613 [Carpinus fangiana]|uniref:Uncharacterized protein n=1 Tax=Carpinus fangiana TaxID=176857 RepID=A0A5N6KT53_9ROSI|nr:hypothetical protein FH972_022613 [Carpinus fangiana]